MALACTDPKYKKVGSCGIEFLSYFENQTKRNELINKVGIYIIGLLLTFEPSSTFAYTILLL